MRVGGQRVHDVDVRVIAATNKDLPREIEESRFREDLFYRLNVVPVHVPPLRERREDIPLLVRHFTNQMANRERIPTRSFTEGAVDLLARRDWPGNVRELRNTVERLLILSAGDTVTEADVMLLTVGGGAVSGLNLDGLGHMTFQEFRDQAERAFLLQRLRDHEWNVSETARSIDMPRSNLYKKIERFGLTREE